MKHLFADGALLTADDKTMSILRSANAEAKILG